MNFISFLRTCLFLGILAVGVTFLNVGTANAVADVSVSVNDSGSNLGGATVSLTAPDGTTQTYRDDDNDGRIGFVLGNPGRYRMTITTADGRSTSTSFNAPEDGGVMVDYDVSRGSARVSVNDTGSRSAGQGSDSPWSWGLYGAFGFTDWQGQFDNGGSINEGETGKLRKYGLGTGFRYDLPNYPLFLMSNFFYHFHNRSKERFQSGTSFDLEMRERWKWQFMLGWTFMQRPKVAWALMVGFTLARVQMNIFSGNSLIQHEAETQVTPTFGTELMFPISGTDRLFFVLGATASIMNSISHNISGDQFLRADNDLQWDTYAGLRVRF